PTELHYLVQCVVFVSSVTQTSAIYTLSLHDALPIWSAGSPPPPGPSRRPGPDRSPTTGRRALRVRAPRSVPADRSSPATVRRRGRTSTRTAGRAVRRSGPARRVR